MNAPQTQRADATDLARNVIHLTLASIASSASLFIGGQIILSCYGAERHGWFMWHVAVIYLATHLTGLISSKAGVRLIARLRAEHPERLGPDVSALITVQMILSLVLAAVLVLLAGPLAALKSGADPAAFRLGALWLVFNGAARAGVMLAVGFERMAHVVLINPSAEVAKFLWAIACAVLNLDILYVFAGWTGAYLISALVAMACGRQLTRQIKVPLRPRARAFRESLRMLWEAFPYFVPFFSVFAPPLLLQIIIGAWESDETNRNVSIFQYCFQLALISRMLSLSVATALFPRVSNIDASARADHAQTTEILRGAGRLLALAGTFVFAFFASIGRLWMAQGWVYSSAPDLALTTLLILCFAIACDNFTQQLDQVLMATRHAAFVAWMEGAKYIVIGGLAVAAILLRPGAAAAGAAIAITAGMLVSLGAKVLMARRELPGVAGGVMARMLILFAAMGAMAIHPTARWFTPVLWLAGVLALRLFGLKDLRQWLGVLVAFLPGRRRIHDDPERTN